VILPFDWLRTSDELRTGLRESPALDLIHLLQDKGADVRYHDPYVPRVNEDGIVMTGVTLNRDVLRTADCATS